MEAVEAVVAYRLGRAREALEDARLLASAGRWNACVNRLYYACFYAVSGLLLQQGLSSSKHTGIRGLFNRSFVRTGRFPKSLASTYNDLFAHRQEGDYIDFVEFDELQVRRWLEQAEAFVEQAVSLSRENERPSEPRT
jgi:uncharacterized protein (UPF0332 family)